MSNSDLIMQKEGAEGKFWPSRPIPRKNRRSFLVGLPLSPEEGAALIRAFHQVKEKEVRDAIANLVRHLSERS